MSLPELTWKLLHWIFTNPLAIEAVTKSELSSYYTDELRERTKLVAIPYPDKTCTRFDITPPIPKGKVYFFNCKADPLLK